MGVNGLLQIVKEIQEPVNLLKYKGKTLAVDTYGWLHRGLISCAQELCQDIPTKKYINSVMKKVDMLRYFGVEPYLVFDGSYLPTKADTALERRKKRQEAQIKADMYTKQGKRSLAFKEFMKAASVTPEMAKSIMVELDMRKVKYVVAPYEADPQMVYLESIGVVDGIILEDSDLLVFGCQTLITKLNDFGDCVEISRKDFDKVSKIRSLGSLTQEQLRLVAILSGCDYTKGVPGVGLITAFLLISKYNDFDRVVNYLKNEGKTVTPEYEDEAQRAGIAFQYQKVFNPIEQRVTTLNQEPDECDREYYDSCCGATLEHTLHVSICKGRVHPNTHALLIARELNLGIAKSASVNQRLQTQPVVASRSHSNPQRGIESFFNTSQKQTINPQKATRVPLKPKDTNIMISKKRTFGEIISPNSKKIKAFAGAHHKSTKSEVERPPKLEIANPRNLEVVEIDSKERKELGVMKKGTIPGMKVPNWDISGDLDVPDDMSSSPVKKCIGESASISYKAPEPQYDDDEILEESPIRKKEFSLLAQSLHERFLMKKGSNFVRLECKSVVEMNTNKTTQREDEEEIVEEEQHVSRSLHVEELGRIPVRLGLHQFAFKG